MMFDRSPRRQHPRYPIQIPFLHKAKTAAPAKAGVGWTRNVSQGGVCVELAEPLRPAMPLWVRLQSEEGPIDMEAQVTWAAEHGIPKGGILHGVAFTHIAPYHHSALQNMIHSKGLIRPTKVRLPFDVSVTCWPKGQKGPALQGRTRDISRGGLLLRLPEVVPAETVMQVTVHTTPGPLTVEGAVAWVAPPEGRAPGGPIRHGLRFTRPTWSTSLAFGSLLVESM
jgi:hypothetical protein